MPTSYRPLAVIGAAAVLVSGLSAGSVASASQDPGLKSKSDVPLTVTGLAGSASDTGQSASRTDGVCGPGFGIPTGNGLASWSGPNPYDVAGAADFVCSSAYAINQVDVLGYYGPGGSTQFKVTVYADNPGTHEPLNTPAGTVCATQTVNGTTSGGTLSQTTLILSPVCAVQAATTYWLEVQEVHPTAPWYWATQTLTGAGYDADWRDTTGVFGLGCTPGYVDSRYMQDCVYGGPVGEPDFLFQLTGSPPAPCAKVDQLNTQFDSGLNAVSIARNPRPEGADDFFCNGPAGTPLEVVSVGWKGRCFFGAGCPPAGFSIRIYADSTSSPSVPGSLICAQTVYYTSGFGGPGGAPVGSYQQTQPILPNSSALRLYEATLPSVSQCQLVNGVKYWLAVVAKPNLPSVWKWERGTGPVVDAPADWRQPLPISTCLNWGNPMYMEQCTNSSFGAPNFMFRINT